MAAVVPKVQLSRHLRQAAARSMSGRVLAKKKKSSVGHILQKEDAP